MLDETLVKTLAKTRMATQTAVQTLGATGAADCCQAVAATVAAAAEPAVGVHRARGLRRRRRRPLSSHPLLYCGPQVCYQGVPCTPPAVRGSRLFDHVHSPPTTLTHSLLHLFCSLPRPCSPPPPRFVTCSLPPARHSTPTVHSQPPCSPRPVPGSSPSLARAGGYTICTLRPPSLSTHTWGGRRGTNSLSPPSHHTHTHKHAWGGSRWTRRASPCETSSCSTTSRRTRSARACRCKATAWPRAYRRRTPVRGGGGARGCQWGGFCRHRRLAPSCSPPYGPLLNPPAALRPSASFLPSAARPSAARALAARILSLPLPLGPLAPLPLSPLARLPLSPLATAVRWRAMAHWQGG